MRSLAVLMVIGVFCLAAFAAAFGGEQTICPVMEGNPIDKNIYVDYQGTRVYFCCQTCRGLFLEDPAKYRAKLPQFSEGEGGENEERQEPGEFNPARLIEPAGISAFSCLIATALCGLFMKKNRKRLLPLHRLFGVLTVLSALTHAVFLAMFR